MVEEPIIEGIFLNKTEMSKLLDFTLDEMEYFQNFSENLEKLMDSLSTRDYEIFNQFKFLLAHGFGISLDLRDRAYLVKKLEIDLEREIKSSI